MKHRLFSAALVLALATTVFAGDIPFDRQQPPPTPPASSTSTTAATVVLALLSLIR